MYRMYVYCYGLMPEINVHSFVLPQCTRLCTADFAIISKLSMQQNWFSDIRCFVKSSQRMPNIKVTYNLFTFYRIDSRGTLLFIKYSTRINEGILKVQVCIC